MMMVLVSGGLTNIYLLILILFIIKTESLLKYLKCDFKNLMKKTFLAFYFGWTWLLMTIPLFIICSIYWKEFLIALGQSKIIDIDIHDQYLIRHFDQIDSWWKISVMFMEVGILGPLVEEFCFRFLLYRFLRERIWPLVAMIVSSVVFATMHFNLVAWLPLFAMGFVLVHSYEYFRSILVPMVIHGSFNMLVVCSLFYSYNFAK
jgi:membrane protease YdiL (CAAX protease family)